MANQKIYTEIKEMKKLMEELTDRSEFWDAMDGDPGDMCSLLCHWMRQSLTWPHAKRTALWAVIQSGSFTPIGYGFYLPTTEEAMNAFKTIDRCFKKRLPLKIKVLNKGENWDTFEINPFNGEWRWL